MNKSRRMKIALIVFNSHEMHGEKLLTKLEARCDFEHFGVDLGIPIED